MPEDLERLIEENPNLVDTYRQTFALSLANPGHRLTKCPECGERLILSGAIHFAGRGVCFCAKCGDSSVMPQAVLNTFYSRYGDTYYRPNLEDYNLRIASGQWSW